MRQKNIIGGSLEKKKPDPEKLKEVGKGKKGGGGGGGETDRQTEGDRLRKRHSRRECEEEKTAHKYYREFSARESKSDK